MCGEVVEYAVMTELFVYGTLKQGGKWHHLMESSQFLGDDAIKGEMYVDVYFPYLFEGDDRIEGEVYDVQPKEYGVIAAMEGDDYNTQTVVSENGRSVVVFMANDDTKRDPEKRITVFDSASFFQKWLDETPRDSQSWEEYVKLGGKDPHAQPDE